MGQGSGMHQGIPLKLTSLSRPHFLPFGGERYSEKLICAARALDSPQLLGKTLPAPKVCPHPHLGINDRGKSRMWERQCLACFASLRVQ